MSLSTAFDLRFFTAPAILNHISEAHLAALLTPYAFALRGLGCDVQQLPINRDQLKTCLEEAGESFPAQLANTLYVLNEMGQDDGFEMLQKLAAIHDLPLIMGESDTQFTYALSFFLIAPDLFMQAHAQSVIPGVRTYYYWQSDLPADERHIPTPTSDTITAWSLALNQWMIDQGQGAGVKIFHCIRDHKLFFTIQHGAHMKRVNAMQDGAYSSIIYRPALTDVVFYDLMTGEIGMHLEQNKKPLKAQYIATMQSFVIQKPASFASEPRYRLDPLIDNAEAALSCADIPGLSNIKLLEISVKEDEDLSYSIRGKRTLKKFKQMQQACLDACEDEDEPIELTLESAKFHLLLHNGLKRTVTIYQGHKAKYQRDSDTSIIEHYLLKRGFLFNVANKSPLTFNAANDAQNAENEELGACA